MHQLSCYVVSHLLLSGCKKMSNFEMFQIMLRFASDFNSQVKESTLINQSIVSFVGLLLGKLEPNYFLVISNARFLLIREK